MARFDAARDRRAIRGAHVADDVAAAIRLRAVLRKRQMDALGRAYRGLFGPFSARCIAPAGARRRPPTPAFHICEHDDLRALITLIQAPEMKLFLLSALVAAATATVHFEERFDSYDTVRCLCGYLHVDPCANAWTRRVRTRKSIDVSSAGPCARCCFASHERGSTLLAQRHVRRTIPGAPRFPGIQHALLRLHAP